MREDDLNTISKRDGIGDSFNTHLIGKLCKNLNENPDKCEVDFNSFLSIPISNYYAY